MRRQFVYSVQDFITNVRRSPETGPTLSKFDENLRAHWKDRMNSGLFRYRLGDIPTRIIPGRHGYVAQLNVKRATEKRKPQEIQNVQQQFNANKFNFNKVSPEEIIFEMTKEGDVNEKRQDEPGKMVVLINVSPLEFGHCLFVPDPSLCFPQVLTKFAIQSSIESILLSSDPGFRMGFNSLGAFATVNHLHLHGYYLNHELQIESKSAQPLLPEKGFHRFPDFPGGFLFYTESDGVVDISRTICKVTDFLLDNNVAHNVFLTRGHPPCDQAQNEESQQSRNGVRVVVWPRIPSFGSDEPSAFSIALCEMAGHLPFKNKTDYEVATEEDVKDIIQGQLFPKDELHTLEQRLIHHLRHV
ncbi:GDP-D-glucose phosphorylase 1-like isoform X1 [Takifugu rubripes]|uniref:GDP-D-glucose phosphorylase 1-like isoform X1 n=1 Tax=Takifugu rubripes TaxID=31033 RepID=UPI00114575DE|nr:GDP-D-glucose phosphorylase 1-like isoform X1 [Takifugu rubripes]